MSPKATPYKAFPFFRCLFALIVRMFRIFRFFGCLFTVSPVFAACLGLIRMFRIFYGLSMWKIGMIGFVRDGTVWVQPKELRLQSPYTGVSSPSTPEVPQKSQKGLPGPRRPPKGPFHTKNAIAMEIVVFCYCDSILLSLPIRCHFSQEK